MIRNNVIAEEVATTGKGVYCSFGGHLVGNLISGFSQPNAFCHDAGGNLIE